MAMQRAKGNYVVLNEGVLVQITVVPHGSLILDLIFLFISEYFINIFRVTFYLLFCR